jgi:hypothetical protein
MEQVLVQKLTVTQLVKKFPAFYYKPEGSLPCSHESPSLVTILSQLNPIHNFPPYFFKVHYNIILPSAPGSSKWFLHSNFPTSVLWALISLMPVTCPPPPTKFLNFTNLINIWWRVQNKKFLIIKIFTVSFYILPLRIKYSHHPILKTSTIYEGVSKSFRTES